MKRDLRLVLHGDNEGEEIEIMALHQVLANASPVFEAMLQPGTYREGIDLFRDKSLRLSLPEDNAEAMNVICNVLHLQSRKIALLTATPHLLDNIATLIDKYNLGEAIQPWPQIWLEQEYIQAELEQIDHQPIEEAAKWIHISFHLGYTELFEKLTSVMIRAVSLDDFDQELGQLSKAFTRLPLCIQEKIKLRRQRCADQFRRLSTELVEHLEEGNGCKGGQKFECTQEEAFDCSSILLGNTLLALREAFGSNWRSEEAWTTSTTEMYDHMVQVGKKLTGLMAQLKPIYNAAIDGLQLREAGIILSLEADVDE